MTSRSLMPLGETLGEFEEWCLGFGDVKVPWISLDEMCETPRFFLCWKFLIGEWFECVGCCKRLVLKRHPWYGNFFEFWSQQKWCQTEFMNSESGGYEWLNDGKGCKNEGEGGGDVPTFSSFASFVFESRMIILDHIQCVQTDFIESFQPGADGGRDH